MSTANLLQPNRGTDRLQQEFMNRVVCARTAIPAQFRNSPSIRFTGDSLGLEAEIIVKLESLNPIRSFKGRGTSWYVQQLLSEYAAKGSENHLVCASAGNFGQGLAVSCKLHGLALTVCAPKNASPSKVQQMRLLGAEVILEGEDFDSAKSTAVQFAQRTGARFVEDGSDPSLMEGAATIAAELLEQEPRISCLLVPVGNGSLVNGIAKYVKLTYPNLQVIGVCPAGAPSMELSFRAGHPVSTDNVRTIADGLAVRVPVAEAVREMCQWVDDVILVSDDSIRAAQKLLACNHSLLSEPSGAAGIAGLLEHGKSLKRFVGKDGMFATVLCGASLGLEGIRRIFI